MGFPALESCLFPFKRPQKKKKKKDLKEKQWLRLGLLNLKKKEDKMRTQGHWENKAIGLWHTQIKGILKAFQNRPASRWQ